jgi:hypothetical protein
MVDRLGHGMLGQQLLLPLQKPIMQLRQQRCGLFATQFQALWDGGILALPLDSIERVPPTASLAISGADFSASMIGLSMSGSSRTIIHRSRRMSGCPAVESRKMLPHRDSTPEGLLSEEVD